jgi:predicted component of type VI protein secretion system
VQLIVLDGAAPKPSYDVTGPSAVIGRAPDCDVVINDQEASRHHARISLIDGRYVIEDVEAANRTVVNDRPLDGARPLLDGDLIVIGRVLFQVVVGAAPPAPPPRTARRTGETQPALSGAGPGRPSSRRREVASPAAPAAGDAPASAAPPRARRTRTRSRPGAAAVGLAKAAAPPNRPPEELQVDALRLAAARLSGSADRLAQAARRIESETTAAATRRAEASAVGDRLGAVLRGHADLGGDDEIQRLSGRLHAPVANQTDFGALWALGREATALTRAARLVHQSLALCGDLRRVMGDE